MTKRLLPALRGFMQLLADGEEKPRVHEHGGVRCLRFNGGAVQSSMRIAEPFELDLAYTRAMMGFMLFDPDPRHILLVGLGGGSLSKYCHRQFPQARVTTLEINPEVIALRDDFRMPADDARFRIVPADACEYLARGEARAGVILLDGYDVNGLPECLCSEAFYADCWRTLDAPGVLVANFWGGEAMRARYLDRLRRLFDGRVWWSKPLQSTNLIVYAVKNPRYFPQWAQLTSAARALDAKLRLNLAHVVDDMRRRPDPEG
jgi:spermidine synthase